jgi:hypothetical protein
MDKVRKRMLMWTGAFVLAAAAVAILWLQAAGGGWGRAVDADAKFDPDSDQCCWVAVTDQASHRIVAYDPKEPDWTKEDAVRWSWSANDVPAFESLRSAWGQPTDAKLRRIDAWEGLWVIVTDSRGLAAIVPYPAGDDRKWGLKVGGNPHSAELLPNGNIAVAASTGGWVRVYASSQGPDAADYAEYKFPGAHGVHWDPEASLLWALGDDHLVALKVGGTDRSPELEEVRKIALPTRHGHDLQPVYGDRDRLWVSTGIEVYQFVKSTGTFDMSYSGNESIRRSSVKSVGNLPNGKVVSTVPDYTKGKVGGCGRNTWCTETVDFLPGTETRRLPGSALYKARIWSADYE